MMTFVGQLIPYAAAGIAVAGVWIGAFIYLDFFTHPDVRQWRRISALRGYSTGSMLGETGTGLTIYTRLQREMNLEHHLAVANRPESPQSFITKIFAIGLFSAAGFVALDIFSFAANGSWILGLPPEFGIAVAILGPAIYVSDLRQDVARRQRMVNDGLGDTLMLIAVMTSGRGLPLDDAVRILSRCINTPEVRAIVDNRSWSRLIKENPKSTVELYHAIAQQYGIPMFDQIADAAANANVGFAERDT